MHEHRAIVSEMFSRITLGTEAITFLVDVQGVIGLLKEAGERPRDHPTMIAMSI